MTLYLTDNTSAAEIADAAESGFILGVKYYPAGGDPFRLGVTDLAKARNAIAAMEQCALPLLLHGEVTDADVDIFDREKAFVDRLLPQLILITRR